MSKNKINIWINGIMGKMGSELVRALSDSKNITVTGAISPDHAGQLIECQSSKIEISNSVESLAQTIEKPDVIVDFTQAKVAYDTAIYCAKNNIAFVSGTTGMTDEQKNEIETAFNNSSAKAIIAPNFSLGVVLMMELSAKAAPFFKEVEIVEIHNVTKLDSPSGTAITTAKMVNAAKKNAGQEEVEIPIHSLRLSGAIPHQQVHLSLPGEVLRIEHDANDRSCFMPGVILSIEKVQDLDHMLFSIAPLLFDTDI